MTYEDFDEPRVRHLELIQAVITRLSNLGFLVKGWAITVVVALLGFSISQDNAFLALVAAIALIAFWTLDAYLLKSERLFRRLFDDVRRGDDTVAPFFMSVTERSETGRSRSITWFRTTLSHTLLIFYGCIGASALLVAAILDSL